MTLEEFLKRVEKTETCWLWTGWINKGGYGQLTVYVGKTKKGETKVRNVLAHRLSYELHKGPIPKRKQIRHLPDVCSYRHCVNPDHITPGTRSQNMQDVGPANWSRIRKQQWARVPKERRIEIAKNRWAALTPEQREAAGEKISASKRGKPMSEEARAKMSLAKLGKPAKLTAEQRAQKNAAIKAAWARRKANGN